MTKRMLIFVPVYNCEKQLPRVLEKINQHVRLFASEVLIIDNRSQDQTIEAAKKASENLSIKVKLLRNRENYGLGGSIKRAFLYAIENHYDYMIVIHGDDQADIRDLIPLLERNEQADYDLIVGSRFHAESILIGYSKIRIAGNKILNFICGCLNRRKVDDLIAGLNCFNLEFFQNRFFLALPNDLTFDAHVLLYAFSKKARIKHIPITWREEDQVSNAKAVRQALVLLKLFIIHFFVGENAFVANKSGRSLSFDYSSEIIFEKMP